MSLAAAGLECYRHDRPLLGGLGLSLARGEVLAIEGANGSGKTTLLRMLCGLIDPDEGEVTWHGEDVRRIRGAFRAAISYLGHGNGLKSELTPRENLAFARHLGQRPAPVSIDEVLRRVGLAEQADTRLARLSAGQNRRAALARLLVTRAELWLLDEPLTALDSAGIGLLEELVSQQAGGGGMVVMATHHAVNPPGCRVSRLRLGNDG